MSIIFEDLIKQAAVEKNDGPEYQAYFAKKLAEAGYASPADIPEDKKKAFYDSVDKGWSSDKEDVGSDTGDDKKPAVEKKAEDNKYLQKVAKSWAEGRAASVESYRKDGSKIPLTDEQRKNLVNDYNKSRKQRVAGAVAGTAGGAALGAALPGKAKYVGAAVGSIAGNVAGSKAGKAVQKRTLEKSVKRNVNP